MTKYYIQQNTNGHKILMKRDEYNRHSFCLLHRSQNIDNFNSDLYWEGEVVRVITDKRGKNVEIVKLTKPCTYTEKHNCVQVLNETQYQKGYTTLHYDYLHNNFLPGEVIDREIADIPDYAKDIIKQLIALGVIRSFTDIYCEGTDNIALAIAEKIKRIIEGLKSKQTKYFDTEEDALNYIAQNGGTLQVKNYELEWGGEVYTDCYYCVQHDTYDAIIQQLNQLYDKAYNMWKREI